MESIMAANRGMTEPFTDCSRRLRIVRRMKSTAQTTKMVIEKSWKTIPATMMCVPVAVSPPILSASPEAMPPPTAWTTSEIMSQVQKIQRYRLGFMKEDSGPRSWMKRPRRM